MSHRERYEAVFDLAMNGAETDPDLLRVALDAAKAIEEIEAATDGPRPVLRVLTNGDATLHIGEKLIGRWLSANGNADASIAGIVQIYPEHFGGAKIERA